MRPDNDADMPHWGKFKRRKPMTRVSRGGLPPSLFFLPPDSLARYSRFYPPYVMSARVTPSFTPVLLPSVLLLSGGGGGVGGRKVLPLLYSPLQPPPPPATTTTCTTSTSSWSSSIPNDEDSADLTKSFQELSRRLPVLVNSGHRLGSLDSLNRAGTPLPDYFRGSYFSFSFSCTFFFFSSTSQVWIFSFPSCASFRSSQKCVNAKVCPWRRHTEAACLPRRSRQSCSFYFSVVSQMLSK